MAGGAVIQVVAVGQQDVYLTQSPMITFFKAVYRRYTNFAIESVEQTFNGSPAFGNKVSAVISRNGDLVKDIVLRVELPALAGTAVAWVPEVGHQLIENVFLSVGGQKVIEQYGEFYSIWNELTRSASQKDGYADLIGDRTILTTTGGTIPAATIYVPLQFFCKDAGLALPLIALAYHEVKVEFSFRSLLDLTVGTVTGSPSMVSASLYVDYIFLDADERKSFAQSPHEYLIDQLQYHGSDPVSGSTHRSRLSFNHPTKELIWTITPTGNDLLDFTVSGADTFATAKLQLNGNDRFSERDAMTFNLIQPLQHHTSTPRKGIYCYSFSLEPEKHQPSGTLNFSRIDNATLHLTSPTAGDLKVYAVNYNIFRAVSGMGGIAYNS